MDQVCLKSHLRDIVEITTNHGVFRAQKCLVTLPFGYLKKHHQSLFNPSLPTKKITSMKHIHFGLLDKIVLKFDHSWWPTLADSFYMLTNELGSPGLVWVVNHGGLVNESILVCYVSGAQARTLEALPENEAIARIMKVLRENFADVKVPDPIKFARTQWERDPFALGSYTVWLVVGTTLIHFIAYSRWARYQKGLYRAV